MKQTLKALRRRAWKIFSEYIRKRDRGICFTCGSRGDWKEMHAGHLFHRDALDFNEKNINCQCVKCNTFMHGNLGEYTYRFILRYGKREYLRLKKLTYQIKRFKRQELEEIIKKYK